MENNYRLYSAFNGNIIFNAEGSTGKAVKGGSTNKNNGCWSVKDN